MAASTTQHVRKRREAMRAAGLRPVQIWIPDTRNPGVAEECRRQSLPTAAAEADDADLAGFLNAAFHDLDDATGS